MRQVKWKEWLAAEERGLGVFFSQTDVRALRIARRVSRGWRALVDSVMVSRAKGNHSQLVYLSLSWCGNLSDEVLRSIPIRCPNIRLLNVSFTTISGEALKGVVENLPNLRALGVANCPNVKNLTPIWAPRESLMVAYQFDGIYVQVTQDNKVYKMEATLSQMVSLSLLQD